MNRQIFPQTGFPVLDGDVFSTVGSTSCIVTGIQGIPVQDAYFPLANYDTMFYNSTENIFYFANPWEIPVGQVLEFEGYGYSPVGISWLASDTIAIGDGTQGDVSGAAAMTALILFGSSAYADYDLYHTTIYSGATVDWSLVLPETAGSSGQVLTTNGQGFTYWSNPSNGTVTSVGFKGDGVLLSSTESGPVTNSGTLSATLNTQSANSILAGPASGAAATPTFRSMVVADLPNISTTGVAGFWPSFGTLAICNTETAITGWSATLGYFMTFYLPQAITLDHATIDIPTVSASASKQLGIGIYPAVAGSTALFTATVNVSTGQATGVRAMTVSGSVTLPAGYYYYTMTTNATDVDIPYWTSGSPAVPLNILNKNGVRTGTYTPGTPGTPDTTLPPLTANTSLNSFGWIVLLEP